MHNTHGTLVILCLIGYLLVPWVSYPPVSPLPPTPSPHCHACAYPLCLLFISISYSLDFSHCPLSFTSRFSTDLRLSLSSLLTSHCCSSSGFPCVWLRLVYWSLRSTATFVICVHWSLLFAFSLHFLPPLPFSYISSHSPPILALVFLFSGTFLLLCLWYFR